jgi:hypothetical protein
MPVPELLKGWDYSTPLRFECQVTMNLDMVRADCGLESDAQVAAISIFWATSTNRREVGATALVDHSGEVSMSFDINPRVVGGKLSLHRQLVLMRPGGTTSPFAATRAGAVLWAEERIDRTAVVLEGDAARFPTEVIDFRIGNVAEQSAAWWLHHDFKDMDASPLASMRLYVNASHRRVEAVLSGKSDEATQLVAAVMSWDVGRIMIHAALDSLDFVDGWGQFRTGSLGETLELLVGRVWPTHDARTLRQMRSDDRGLFEARLQGRLDALGMHK